MIDRLFTTFDSALRTVFASHPGSQPCPTLPGDATELSEADKKESGALMRVNHVGEVCAQALTRRRHLLLIMKRYAPIF